MSGTVRNTILRKISLFDMNLSNGTQINPA